MECDPIVRTHCSLGDNGKEELRPALMVGQQVVLN